MGFAKNQSDRSLQPIFSWPKISLIIIIAFLPGCDPVPPPSSGELINWYKLNFPNEQKTDFSILELYVEDKGKAWLEKNYPDDYEYYEWKVAGLAGMPSARDYQDSIKEKLPWRIAGVFIGSLIIAFYIRAAVRWVCEVKISYKESYISQCGSTLFAIFTGALTALTLARSAYPTSLDEHLAIQASMALYGGIAGFIAQFLSLYFFLRTIKNPVSTNEKRLVNSNPITLFNSLKIVLTLNFIGLSALIGVIMLIEGNFWGLLGIIPFIVSTWWFFISFKGKVENGGAHNTQSINIEDEKLFEIVASELDSGDLKGLWLKAETEADGNQFKTKQLYTKWRISQLTIEVDEATQSKAREELAEAETQTRQERNAAQDLLKREETRRLDAIQKAGNILNSYAPLLTSKEISDCLSYLQSPHEKYTAYLNNGYWDVYINRNFYSAVSPKNFVKFVKGEMKKKGHRPPPMTSEEQTKTWEFLAELATFDGSTEQIDDWVNRYSSNDMSGASGITYDSNKKKFLERFSKNDMINIVKATTLLEMNKGFFMGSVHPAIPIIKLIREIHPEECGELDTWVLKNSTNTLIPWGRSRGRFKTLQEVQDDYWTRLAKSAAEEERQEQEHAAKMERDKAKAQHNIYNAIRRKDVGAIEAMIAKGVDLDKPNDEGKSPRAYAEELGDEKVLGVLGSTP